jgi:hypothetical protein
MKAAPIIALALFAACGKAPTAPAPQATAQLPEYWIAGNVQHQDLVYLPAGYHLTVYIRESIPAPQARELLQHIAAHYGRISPTVGTQRFSLRTLEAPDTPRASLITYPHNRVGEFTSHIADKSPGPGL